MSHQAAFAAAFERASVGLDWDYPCLVWLSDYLAAAGCADPAQPYRGRVWTEGSARMALARLAVGGRGSTAVECAMHVLAMRHGWVEVDGPRQGCIMVGVYSPDGDVGVPAIFDGDRRWLISGAGNAMVTLASPARMWTVPGA